VPSTGRAGRPPTGPPGPADYSRFSRLAAGYAALGIVETLVHTGDMADGLGLSWSPPDGICARVLARLFPDVPDDFRPWPTLLWACGRAEIPGHPRRTTWRPYPSVPAGR